MNPRFLVAAILGVGLSSIILLALVGLPYSPLSSVNADPYGPQPGSISGTVFNDTDGDGILDGGESGISGVTVCVAGVGCTTSNPNGGYSFSDLDQDTYGVYEFIPAGFANTTPTTLSIIVSEGENVVDVNFGNRTIAPPPSDITIVNSGGTTTNGTPTSSRFLDLVIEKTITVCNPVGQPKSVVSWADGTVLTANMKNVSGDLWTVTYSPTFPGGIATLRVDIDCPPDTPGYPEDISLISGEDAIEIGNIVFLDPSGTILNSCTNGPLEGATVTLLKEDPEGSGIFVVPSTADHLPATNPETSGVDGSYAWVVVPGTYKVSAAKSGFSSGDSGPLVIPPPAVGIDISLTPAGGCEVDGDVDIKPGSDPNAVNVKSKGVIPVAILGSTEFDAASVVGESVLFAGASPAHEGGHLEDVDDDGDLDWVGHFKTQETDIAKGDTEACLTADTGLGQTISGCDSIKTVGK